MPSDPISSVVEPLYCVEVIVARCECEVAICEWETHAAKYLLETHKVITRAIQLRRVVSEIVGIFY